MSQNRYDQAVDEAPGAHEPRCSLKHAKEARRNYCGTVREPRHPDELGALCVVDLLMAGGVRRAFFPLEGIDQCRIVDLPALGPRESMR